MNELNDGGPAFPHPNNAPTGMTLRDYFAAHIIQGLLAGKFITTTPDMSNEKAAYIMADVMLKERDK